MKRQLLEPVEVAMSHPKPSMWDDILETYTSATETGADAYLVKAKSALQTDTDINRWPTDRIARL